MALMKCKECGKEISTTAANCPHCGCRTAHGRTVSEAKVYLVWAIINFVLLIVGLILFLGNFEEFIDRFDYLDRYKYFSEEGKAAVRNFLIGAVMMIGCFVDSCYLWNRLKDMQAKGNNGFQAQDSEWRCQRCDTLNQSKATSCVRCGAGRGGVQVYKEEKIPAWKRVEMEEAEKSAAHEAESASRKCPQCGAEQDNANQFCGICGTKL